MIPDQTGERRNDPEFTAFFKRLLDRASRERLPELFSKPPAEVLYHVPNRAGVSVVALRTTSLSSEQLRQIMTYRLAQYVVLNYVNTDTVYAAGLEHESMENVGPDDVHVIAGSADGGEVLCYIVLKAEIEEPAGTTLRTRDRSLFPVEQIFGWGVFNRLLILPDLPVARIRELERFVKNQQRQTVDDLTARAPVEISLAVFRVLLGPLRPEVDACICDIEQDVAKPKKLWDFFHVPNVVIHGVVPYLAADTYPWPSYQYQTRYPSAFLSSDVPLERLNRIEQALALPGKHGLAALFQLKNDPIAGRSSLEPPEGLGPLADATVPQQGVAMIVRRQEIDFGDWLRATSFFRNLSVAEAAVLGTFMERQTAQRGDVLVRQGEAGDDLYLIEAGRAEVQVVGPSGHRMIVAELGPGDCFGEIALVTGGERTADVVAVTPITLMRLSHDAYTRYLAHLVDVDNQLTHTALERARQTLRAVRSTSG